MSVSNCAVIVDNRLPEKEFNEVKESHMKFLDGWVCVSLRPDHIKSSMDYNHYLTSVEFWKIFQDFNRILIFQHDTGILREGIEEFLEWDYVGAPWKINAPWAHPERKGGNGGLSLRCPKKALELIQKYPFDSSSNEDVFFTRNLEKIEAKVAPYEICKKFSCETEFMLGTFGYHAIETHLSQNQVKEIKTQYI